MAGAGCEREEEEEGVRLPVQCGVTCLSDAGDILGRCCRGRWYQSACQHPCLISCLPKAAYEAWVLTGPSRNRLPLHYLI